MAYFPPFKMFFLLMALSLLVMSGLNIRLENRFLATQQQIEASVSKIFVDNANTIIEQNNIPMQDQAGKKTYSPDDVANMIHNWIPKHIGLLLFLTLLLFSVSLYLTFRKSSSLRAIRFSGFFVAMVYIYNMLMIYSVILNFFCLSSIWSSVLAIIPLKQLSGYSYGRTLLKIILALPIFALILIVLSVLVSIGIGIVFYIYSLW
jgi:hypothetical protein